MVTGVTPWMGTLDCTYQYLWWLAVVYTSIICQTACMYVCVTLLTLMKIRYSIMGIIIQKDLHTQNIPHKHTNIYTNCRMVCWPKLVLFWLRKSTSLLFLLLIISNIQLYHKPAPTPPYWWFYTKTYTKKHTHTHTHIHIYTLAFTYAHRDTPNHTDKPYIFQLPV